MDPTWSFVLSAITLVVGVLGGFWWKARSDWREQRRFDMETAEAEKLRQQKGSADIRAGLERGEQTTGPGEHIVTLAFRNVGRAPALDVTFELTSVHNPGCHVIWAPAHVPIKSLMPGQVYRVGGGVSEFCPEPLRLIVDWSDDIGKHSLEMQLTSL